MTNASGVEQWEHFFKPESRSSGRSLFNKSAVRLSQPSDTEIQAYVQGSSPIKLSFKSPSVESPLIRMNCSCPNGKKGQFCKHLWAGLLTIETSKPDFLEGKRDIEINENAQEAAAAKARPVSAERVEAQEKQKLKQNEYRKEQYQKQKQRLKEMKSGEKAGSTTTSGKSGRLGFSGKLPDDVAAAVEYFSQNGVPLDIPLETSQIQHAKKILSRVFHPDKGGTHAEILQLNQNCDVLLAYAAT